MIAPLYILSLLFYLNILSLLLGHMEISNGSTYDGTFSKGLPNGVGVMRFPDSSRYEGEFMQVEIFISVYLSAFTIF